MLVRRIAAKLVRSQRPNWAVPCASFSSSVTSHESDDDDDLPKPKDAFGGASYQWEDPLRLRSQLNEEELAVWDAARAFCDGELMPGILEANRHEIPCDHAMMKVRRLIILLSSFCSVLTCCFLLYSENGGSWHAWTYNPSRIWWCWTWSYRCYNCHA